MEETIAPTVTATSVMLGAYGFFYGALKDRIDAGFAVGLPEEGEGLTAQRRTVSTAKKTALALGLIPLAIWVIFLKAAVEEIEAGFDVGFSLSHYSPLNIVFVLLAFAWLFIAFILLRQYVRLRKEEEKFSG